jgi:integrase
MLYFRRKVPLELRAQFGKTEIWVSLGTANVWEARARLAEENGRFEDAVKAARMALAPVSRPPQASAELSRSEVDAAVRAWLLRRMELDEQSDFGGLDAEGDRGAEVEQHARLVEHGIRGKQPQLSTEWIAAHLIERHGWTVERGSGGWRYLLRRIAAAELEHSRRVQVAVSFPSDRAADPAFSDHAYEADARNVALPRSGVRLMALFDAYVQEARQEPATVKAFRGCLTHLVEFLGHGDATKISPDDIIRWKEHLLTEKPDGGGEPRGARTVRDKYLAAARAVFRWAKANRKVQTDPVEGITVRVPKKPRLRESGFTDAEAKTILQASLGYKDDAAPRSQSFARRWVPWLCAYTGARVGEITQLRAEDVSEREGIWCIRITPEAGGQKKKEARIVPLHLHLVEQGFSRTIKGAAGPLFYEPERYRGGTAGNPQSKKVAERIARWVREDLHVSDKGVQPNHGWRHRFKTEARRVRMDPEMRDGIQGHARHTEGHKYGDMPHEAVFEEICRLRRYKIDKPAAS